jgi:prepilin signal peptidase PulO-like enzyme (type II secretory pathway)
VPASHCPHCGQSLHWFDNIPLLGYLLLRGRCRHCQAVIAWQYPAVELATALIFVWSLGRYGMSADALAWAGFASTLLALAVIDARTTLLPDALTQPLTWAGLMAASMDLSGLPLADALWGAVAGYLFLWSVYWLFRLVTGQEGMGRGDFKLMAALGAWFGWQALIALVMIASLSGLAVGLWLQWRLWLQSPMWSHMPTLVLVMPTMVLVMPTLHQMPTLLLMPIMRHLRCSSYKLRMMRPMANLMASMAKWKISLASSVRCMASLMASLMASRLMTNSMASMTSP